MQQLTCADCGRVLASTDGPSRPLSWPPSPVHCESDKRKRREAALYEAKGKS